MAEKLNETDARQGRSGKPILFVLIAGVALIVLGYVVIASIGVSSSPDGSLEQSDTLSAPDAGASDETGEVVTPAESDPQDNNGVKVPE